MNTSAPNPAAIRMIGRQKKTLNDDFFMVVGYDWTWSMFFEMMSHFMLEGRLSDRALQRVNDGLRRIMDGLEVAFQNEAQGKDARTLAHSFFAALNGIMISFAKYPGRSPEEIRKRKK